GQSPKNTDNKRQADQNPRQKSAEQAPNPKSPPIRRNYFDVVNSPHQRPSNQNRNHLPRTAPNPIAEGKNHPSPPSAQREINR
ncbi:hypothetical protein, partial [Paraburkholderia aspalathi]|uniref:hypothetical protein n=1 Tax=Paraburkholderia aspalathi TaxID=1324617 RepID=UPI001BA8BC26